MKAWLTTALLAATAIIPHSAWAATPDGPTNIIPGPRDCFWQRGPFSADPFLNIAYPDANTFYWSASFSIPAGARLSLAGQFPHARYMSFISYDERGRPIEALADYLIAPDAGSANPFRPGADRTATKRGYSVELVDRPSPLGITEGIEVPGGQRQHLSTPKYGAGQQTVIYRIYANDARHPVTGGAPLPEPVLTLANGKTLRGARTCAILKTEQPLQLDPGALGIPVPQYRSMLKQPGKPDTWPAEYEPRWYIQSDRASLIGIYTGERTAQARRSEGGFYPNPDNNYVRTIVNLRHGRVALLRMKAPTVPHTADGAARMGKGQLRYWSVCSNQGFANTRVNDCVFDEETPVDARGYVTIAISKAKDRPRNARPECGLQWLPVADDGDGVVDPDVAVVQIRHLLADPDFAEAIQKIPSNDRIAESMGEYAPKMRYVTPSAVETVFPCL